MLYFKLFTALFLSILSLGCKSLQLTGDEVWIVSSDEPTSVSLAITDVLLDT